MTEKLVEALKATLPLLVRLGDYIGNVDDIRGVGTGINRCDVIRQVKDAIDLAASQVAASSTASASATEPREAFALYTRERHGNASIAMHETEAARNEALINFALELTDGEFPDTLHPDDRGDWALSEIVDQGGDYFFDTVYLAAGDKPDPAALLRAALVGLVRVDGREELERMELLIRQFPAADDDKAAALNGVHALLATLPATPEQKS